MTETGGSKRQEILLLVGSILMVVLAIVNTNMKKVSEGEAREEIREEIGLDDNLNLKRCGSEDGRLIYIFGTGFNNPESCAPEEESPGAFTI